MEDWKERPECFGKGNKLTACKGCEDFHECTALVVQQMITKQREATT